MRPGHSFLPLAVLASVLVMPSAMRADGYIESGSRPGQCIHLHRSSILDLPSTSDMEAEVTSRFEHALEVSRAEPTVYSRSPLYPWANEAKIACGKAIGYFKGRETNVEMVSKCDCYYSRMVHYMR